MGKIFNIQRFCIDDGPGIRTTVFFSGCPLRCEWCHNPESFCIDGAVFYDPSKCISCGRCASLCLCHKLIDGKHVFDREGCISCGKCAELGCGALEYTVKDYSAEEVIDAVKKDLKFFEKSGGGLTVSGGEPMMQFDFLYDVLRLAKENNIHTCLETSGFAQTDKLEKIKNLVDIFLYDYKLSDSEKHKRYTGMPNDLIKKNLEKLNAMGASIVLRCVIIPTVNDDAEHLRAIGKIADSMEGIKEVWLEPYHDLGNSKRYNLGKEPVFSEISAPSKEDVLGYIKAINTTKPCIY